MSVCVRTNIDHFKVYMVHIYNYQMLTKILSFRDVTQAIYQKLSSNLVIDHIYKPLRTGRI